MLFLRWNDTKQDGERSESQIKEERKLKLSRYGQKTTISFNAEEEYAELYTANSAWMMKMDNLMSENPEQFKATDTEEADGVIVAKKYTFPKRFLNLRRKDSKTAILEEKKGALVQRPHRENTIE